MGEISRLNVNNYEMNAYFSRENAFKGGVMILSGEGVGVRQVTVPNSLNVMLLEELQFEFCACSYFVNKFKFLVIGMYRSPSSDVNVFLDRLQILIDYFGKKFDNIIVGGDINIDVLKNDRKHKLLKETLEGLNMRYLVDFPTRVTETSKTAIDNFLIKNIKSCNLKVEGIITCLSDHDGQLLGITNNNLVINSSPIKQEIRKFSRENLTYFSRLLTKETWEDVYFAPVERKYDNFHNTFHYYFDLAFPKTLITKKK